MGMMWAHRELFCAGYRLRLGIWHWLLSGTVWAFCTHLAGTTKVSVCAFGGHGVDAVWVRFDSLWAPDGHGADPCGLLVGTVIRQST